MFLAGVGWLTVIVPPLSRISPGKEETHWSHLDIFEYWNRLSVGHPLHWHPVNREDLVTCSSHWLYEHQVTTITHLLSESPRLPPDPQGRWSWQKFPCCPWESRYPPPHWSRVPSYPALQQNNNDITELGGRLTHPHLSQTGHCGWTWRETWAGWGSAWLSSGGRTGPTRRSTGTTRWRQSRWGLTNRWQSVGGGVTPS